MQEFIHLNVHSHYSILQSQITIPAAVDKAVADGMKGMALTDVGVMYGIKEFVDYCAKVNKERAKEGLDPFKPIIGCEMYVAPRTMHDKEKGDDKCSRLIVLAKNLTGYKNLIKLVSNSWTEGLMRDTPRTDHAELEKYKEGLIVIASGTESEIANHAIAGDIEEAANNARWYATTFGSDFYIGLQRHEEPHDNLNLNGIAEIEYRIEPTLISIAKDCGIKLIATNNCRYLDREDGIILDHLLAVSHNCAMEDAACPHHQEGEWMRSMEEMEHVFSDINVEITNITEILDKVEIYSINNAPLMPSFSIPQEFESETDYLRFLAFRGAKERYGETLPIEVTERLDFELSTIKNMGFPGYFLIVAEIINAARKELGVWVGSGRGSAVGSIVAYCLGITKIDPLKYGLLFERFLNPDKISLPDIDTDFDDDGRAEVIKWMCKRYGSENVAHIITYNTLGAKSAIQAVAKAQNADARYVETSQMQIVKKLEGKNRAKGIHACGMIISPTPISDTVPVCTSDAVDDGCSLVTQYEGRVIESTGLIKMDILGLRTLSELKEACKNIKNVHGIEIDIDNIPLDDEKTFQLYQKGQTIGTFQFESAGMRKYLQELHPTEFADLVAMNALYRPGPLEYIPSYIARKNGKEAITYDHPCMETVLKETYGVTVYQEQVMLLAREFAGFTRGQSDKLRKVISKKVGLEELKPLFVDGGLKNGHSAELIEAIWAKWEKFGEYAFNKSHAVAYSWLAYQTAYLKANYPVEYMAALMTCRSDNKDSIKVLMEECKAMGINIAAPNINSSTAEFTPAKNGSIIYGLCAIKGIGKNVVSEIIRERNATGPYCDVFDFAKRVNNSVCNKRVIEAFAKSGAFDCFGLSRGHYFGKTEKGKSSIDLILDYVRENSGSLFTIDPPQLPCINYSSTELRAFELELTGMAFTPHPIDKYDEVVKKHCNVTCCSLNDLSQFAVGQFIGVAGYITDIRIGISKAGKEYGVVTLEDSTGKVEVAFFGTTWPKHKDALSVNKVVVLKGGIEQFGGRVRFSPRAVYDIDELSAK